MMCNANSRTDVGSSSSITISNSVVKNQDDCLAVNSGTDITFTGNTCSGGHGISIGSVGGRSDNTVKNVKVSNCSIKDSDNGVRIKTVSGATGSVSGVSYSGITLSNIAKYGIVIEQDYENGSPTGTPTTGVPITDLTISNASLSLSLFQRKLKANINALYRSRAASLPRPLTSTSSAVRAAAPTGSGLASRSLAARRAPSAPTSPVALALLARFFLLSTGQ